MAKTISMTNVRKNIYNIASDVCECHEEVLVYNASSGNNVVIVSEEDWNAIQETLYLNSVPGLAESIREAAGESISDGVLYDENEAW